MRDSVWSGPVLAASLVSSAALLIVVSTQVEVTPPPPLAPLVEHTTCSAHDVKLFRERIARMKLDKFKDEVGAPDRSAGVEAEIVAFRRDETAKARAVLARCGRDSEVDMCEGYSRFFRDEWQEQVGWFGRNERARQVLRTFDLIDGMCTLWQKSQG